MEKSEKLENFTHSSGNDEEHGIELEQNVATVTKEFETTQEAADALYNAIFDSIERRDITSETAQNIIVLFQLHPMEYTPRLRDSLRAALQDFYNKVMTGLSAETRNRQKQSSESSFTDEKLQDGIDIIRILRDYLQPGIGTSEHPFDSYLDSRLTSPTAKGEPDDYRKLAYERLLYLISRSLDEAQ